MEANQEGSIIPAYAKLQRESTMGAHWIFCNIFVLFFVFCAESTSSITKQCTKTADDYDCSDLSLSFVPNDIPDSTKSLHFSFNNLPALYNSTFQRLTNLVSVDLTRCNINFIYEDVFQHQPDLEQLILVANPLVFIADSGFTGPVALKYLNLAQSMICSLAEIPTTNLDYLETLDLQGNCIHSLDGLDNFRIEQMKRLNLDMNYIATITAANLKKLQKSNTLEISFKANDLVYVEPNAFHLLNIISLDFSGCFNKMDVSSLLKGLEGIKTNKLYLGSYEDSSNSYITSAGLHSFCNISVSHLDFQLQHFSDLADSSFQCLARLQKLDLTRAHISTLPSNLTNLSTLSHLVLDENSFEDVCHINAANFPMLKHLSISGNLRFLLFIKSCLESLSHLEELQLSHSQLDTGWTCCTEQLSGLNKLKLLNLSYNGHINWELLPFKNTPHLKHLDCSHLRLNLNTTSPFNNLQNLQTLNLSWSETDMNINVDILKGLKNLRVLELKGNAIQNGLLANTDSFNHVPLLEILDLSACNITGFSKNEFESLAKLRHVDLSANQLTTLAGFYSLNQIQLNFAYNKIAVVDVKSIERLGNGNIIDLSHNPLLCSCTNYLFIIWVKENVNKMKHLQETVCNTMNKKILDVDLQCGFSMRTLGIVLAITVTVAVLIAVIYFVRKVKERYINYTVL